MISFLKKIYHAYNRRQIINLYNTNHKKRALISYITHPFRKNSFKHTNYYEALAIADILDGLGYKVDVVYYGSKSIIPLSAYDLIYGFGVSFRDYFDKGFSHAKTIYYGTGMHISHQNSSSLNRVRDVYHKKGKWLTKSARLVEEAWAYHCSLADGIISLGNEQCRSSYLRYLNASVVQVNAPFLKTQDALEIFSKRKINKAKKSFLWFGSSGLIHKGLDLCLDYFSKHPDLTLHVCGDVDLEPDFIEAYNKELYQSNNILTHGFVDINSKNFSNIIESCCFVIFPSCSEGGAPSVLTAIGNGALIPIISKDACISTGSEIWIEELNAQGIECAVDMALKMTLAEIREAQISNLNYVLKNNSKEVYHDSLKKAITKIINY